MHLIYSIGESFGTWGEFCDKQNSGNLDNYKNPLYPEGHLQVGNMFLWYTYKVFIPKHKIFFYFLLVL